MKKAWCQRNRLAIVFATLALALLVVACVQAVMLHSKGWGTPLGTLPEWLSGFGTVFTAAVAVAAYRTLTVATREWEGAERERRALETERQALAATREAERRDHEMSQARLIIVEPSPDPDHPDKVLIHNYSSQPVFKLHIEPQTPTPAVVVAIREYPLNPRDPAQPYKEPPEDVRVLSPGAVTNRLHPAFPPGQVEQPLTELVHFTFTDARGAQWRRLGNQQPVQEFESAANAAGPEG